MSLVINESEFKGNTNTNGAIFINGINSFVSTSLILVNTKIEGNKAYQTGAGIYIGGGVGVFLGNISRINCNTNLATGFKNLFIFN